MKLYDADADKEYLLDGRYKVLPGKGLISAEGTDGKPVKIEMESLEEFDL